MKHDKRKTDSRAWWPFAGFILGASTGLLLTQDILWLIYGGAIGLPIGLIAAGISKR